MTRIALIAGGEVSGFSDTFDLYVGVDRGSLFLLDKDLPLSMAVGDFDSVSPDEFAGIEAATEQLVLAPAQKNDTDLELALKTVFAKEPQARITIFGAFGGRMDHMMCNLFLAGEPDLALFMEQMELCDQQNVVRFYPTGSHRISPVKGMAYVSFMPVDGGKLTIRHAKYPLDESNYFVKACYSSNEFTDKEIEVTLDQGYLVVIYSKDRS